MELFATSYGDIVVDRVVPQFHRYPKIACCCDNNCNNWYIGLIKEINKEKRDVKIDFIHPPGPSRSFTLPEKQDTC